jgi:hypothetical protein
MKWTANGWFIAWAAFVPLFASAQTIDELEQRLKKLQSTEKERKVSQSKRQVPVQGRRPDTRFESHTDGVYDPERQIIWAARDNGSDVNWSQAQAYCAKLGPGWMLPSVAQLRSIYDASGAFAKNLEFQQINPATDRIGLTGVWYWSAAPASSTEAWYVNLGDGVQYSIDASIYLRALCVRRS